MVQTQTGHIQRIDRNSIHYDPLGYALLFPYGEPGFQLYLPNVQGDKISHRQYYTYQLHERVDDNGDDVFNAVLFNSSKKFLLNLSCIVQANFCNSTSVTWQ